MQSLATYSFSADLDAVGAVERYHLLRDFAERWLHEKGVVGDVSGEGSFRSLSGDGGGTFVRRETNSKIGDAFELRLVETTDDGLIFSTEIYFIHENSKVTVFSKLPVIGCDGVFAPVNLDPPRCPKVIRSIISSFDDWRLGGWPIPSGDISRNFGEVGGHVLCTELLTHERNLPIIVVSCDDEEVVWAGLPKEIARNTIGLAHVAVIDEESSWVLSERFGEYNSCYLGAVRVYWPLRGDGGSVPTGPVWSTARQKKLGVGRADMMKFVSHIRGLIMSAAAQTLTAPAGLRNIHAAAMVARITAMSKEVRETELNSIIEENYNLESALSEEKKNNQNYIWEIERLRSQLAVLSGRRDAVEVGVPSGEAAEKSPPKSGETRFYKKIGTGGGVDVMVHTTSRNHPESAWASSHKGDQAVKGIKKLEKRDGWKSIFHCNICTGGGHWRVNW